MENTLFIPFFICLMADGAATTSFELFMDKTYFKKGGKTHE